MLKIRLRRMGNRHRPFFRVVVSDGRQVPTSSAVEEIGFYDPRQSPSMIKINTERIDHWVGQGARMSETVEKLVRKARLQPVTEAAPTKKAAPAAEAAPVEEATPAEEAASTEKAASTEEAASVDETAAPEKAEATDAAETSTKEASPA